ncbi:MAG: 3-hydroxyacyl-CoA dehydrogenase/enoyl-CoA hydratase family protein [Proteobacteria bacterium]|nr:3-hydroxyacyl-CoA dehydrogenase/enoyl-CoA hydratase family protein [Pseudomonadota bacterium]
MGAQIAAHLINAGIQTILYDLPAEKSDQNAIVNESLKSLQKLKPAPFGIQGMEDYIIAANYDADLEKLRQCDLVIEAIAEKIDYKQQLYQKISSYLSPSVILATNTSGLSIHDLAKGLNSALQKRFCGIHFFNPPRYMKLVEVIAHPETPPLLIKQLETFLVTHLGKGVIFAKDTPNFIGNRIGVFSFLSILHHSHELSIAPDIVDALTGPLIARPKSATFRTMDVVGLDTMAHVVNTLKKDLQEDPWYSFFELPVWIKELIDKGSLGQKRGVGIYKKSQDQILVWDHHDKAYRPISNRLNNEVLSILQHPLPMRFEMLSVSNDPQAQLLWCHFRDLFHYCAYHLQSIASTAADIDLAMRWGYGWQEGPFETWQQASWQTIFQKIAQDKKMGKTMSQATLPDWIKELNNGPYQEGKSYCPEKNIFLGGSELAVYHRQYFPDHILTAQPREGDTIFETQAIRLWKWQDKIPVLSFKTKKNSITTEVLEGIQEAIARVQVDYDALVLWQRHGIDFSVGANLPEIVEGLKSKQVNNLDKIVALFQQTALALRYAQVPSIAAIRGLTLGGGCELSMHTTHIVAAFESYVGLVETAIGIIPAGGGCKELALRAAKKAIKGNVYDSLRPYFEQIAMAQVSMSAMDAKRLGYLQTADTIVMNADELLFMGIKQATALADSAYTPVLPAKFPVAGKPGIANFKTYLINLVEGGFISSHDYRIGCILAKVLCGGEVEANSLVDENWMCQLERDAIIELLEMPQTFDRIKYMLEKGKPLRN